MSSSTTIFRKTIPGLIDCTVTISTPEHPALEIECSALNEADASSLIAEIHPIHRIISTTWKNAPIPRTA